MLLCNALEGITRFYCVSLLFRRLDIGKLVQLRLGTTEPVQVDACGTVDLISNAIYDSRFRVLPELPILPAVAVPISTVPSLR